MEDLKYWEDTEYKDALKCYSEYKQMCFGLNEFNPNHQWVFKKRDEYAFIMSNIKAKYKQS